MVWSSGGYVQGEPGPGKRTTMIGTETRKGKTKTTTIVLARKPISSAWQEFSHSFARRPGSLGRARGWWVKKDRIRLSRCTRLEMEVDRRHPALQASGCVISETPGGHSASAVGAARHYYVAPAVRSARTAANRPKFHLPRMAAGAALGGPIVRWTRRQANVRIGDNTTKCT